jgi:hypothetical protein
VRSAHASKARRSDLQRVLSQSRRRYLTWRVKKALVGGPVLATAAARAMAVNDAYLAHVDDW